jgi:hypothetical protein
MDELTGRLATEAGISGAMTVKAVGIIAGIGEIQNIARELFRFGHDKIWADQMT